MNPYADLPAVRYKQIAGDVLMLLWVVVWLWIGYVVFDHVKGLTAPGKYVERAGQALENGLNSIGNALERLPLVGDAVKAGFHLLSYSGGALATAGRLQQSAAGALAAVLALAIIAMPLVWAIRYVWQRVEWTRQAQSARLLMDSAGDASLFALRALAHQPLPVLRDVAMRTRMDLVEGWRTASPPVVAALAELELAGRGLRDRTARH
jgi:hypothetical protein